MYFTRGKYYVNMFFYLVKYWNGVYDQQCVPDICKRKTKKSKQEKCQCKLWLEWFHLKLFGKKSRFSRRKIEWNVNIEGKARTKLILWIYGFYCSPLTLTFSLTHKHSSDTQTYFEYECADVFRSVVNSILNSAIISELHLKIEIWNWYAYRTLNV